MLFLKCESLVTYEIDPVSIINPVFLVCLPENRRNEICEKAFNEP